MIPHVDILVVGIITEIIGMLLYIKILKITNDNNIAIIIWGVFGAAVFLGYQYYAYPEVFWG